MVERRWYIVQVIGWRASVANGVGMSAIAWVDWRQDVGYLASGHQSGWGVLVEHSSGTSVGICLEIA